MVLKESSKLNGVVVVVIGGKVKLVSMLVKFGGAKRLLGPWQCKTTAYSSYSL